MEKRKEHLFDIRITGTAHKNHESVEIAIRNESRVSVNNLRLKLSDGIHLETKRLDHLAPESEAKINATGGLFKEWEVKITYEVTGRKRDQTVSYKVRYKQSDEK